ncbi:MAG: c-type cytochrome [Solirubrobacterales bacterium]|nr:c-type cytochrome [Solirubrobacterales bacterium]
MLGPLSSVRAAACKPTLRNYGAAGSVITRVISGNGLSMNRLWRLGRFSVACAAIAAIALGAAACSTTDDENEDSDTTEQATASDSQLPAEPEQPLGPAQERGRDLFVAGCGSCHTFEPAGTVGQVGPNLSELPRNQAEVLRAIDIGGRGSGSMPPDIYRGREAREVARFVSQNGPGV